MQEVISFFKYLATSNTINFIIMVVILGVIVKKINLKLSFDSAIDKVKTSIKQSDAAKSDSISKLSEAQSAIDHLPQDIAALEKEAIEKAKVFKSKIEESTQKTISSIEGNVDRALAIEEKKLSNLLTGKTVVASVELAKDHIKHLLANDPDLHQQFIQESIDELVKVKL